MRTSFFGLNALLASLRAQQEAIDTTNHNIANANTEGFSRQVASMAPTTPYTLPSANRDAGSALQIGTGVAVSQIKRMRDQFTDVQLRQQAALESGSQTLADGLGQVEGILNEPGDHGIQNLVSDFFNSWSDLANSPNSDAARAAVQQAGQGLASWFNTVGARLEQTRQDFDGAIALQARELNDTATQLAALNALIKRSLTAGDAPNDLQDRRDLLLDKLASLAGATYRQELDGTTTVYVAGRAIVLGADATQITTESVTLPNGKQINQLAWANDYSPVAVDGGELGALLRLRDEILPQKIDQVDALAATIVQQVNAQHLQGVGKGPYAGAPLSPPPVPPNNFFDATKITAATMALDPLIAADLQAIAAAGIPSNGDGDNRNALAMAALQHQAFAALGGQTIVDYHAGNVAALGAETRQAEQTSANQKILADNLRQRRESLSGVSLDEEATSLIRSQRAYQAAARGISAMDEMLETIISRMGRVGL